MTAEATGATTYKTPLLANSPTYTLQEENQEEDNPDAALHDVPDSSQAKATKLTCWPLEPLRAWWAAEHTGKLLSTGAHRTPQQLLCGF